MSSKQQKKTVINIYGFWISLCVEHPDYKWVYQEVFNIINGTEPKKYNFSDKQISILKKQVAQQLELVNNNINSIHRKFSK